VVRATAQYSGQTANGMLRVPGVGGADRDVHRVLASDRVRGVACRLLTHCPVHGVAIQSKTTLRLIPGPISTSLDHAAVIAILHQEVKWP